MPNLDILIRTVRTAIFAALVAWAVAAGVMECQAPDAGKSETTYPLAPINE